MTVDHSVLHNWDSFNFRGTEFDGNLGNRDLEILFLRETTLHSDLFVDSVTNYTLHKLTIGLYSYL